MQVLLNKSLQALTRDPTESSYENLVVYSLQPIMNTYACPCCSYTLLRHVSLEGTYWLCNHCYQKMPVYQPLYSDRNDQPAQALRPAIVIAKLNSLKL